MADYKTKSSAEEAAEEGLLFVGWTQTWGIKVTTWYSMDRLKFSFIQKGASGKGNSFDVCVNAKKDYAFDFLDFAHEVLHDIRTPFDFITIMQKEADAGEQYPKRYKFITGSNGEKSVGFCNSKNGGYCINATSVVNGKKVFANIPVSYYDIYDIVSAFMETYEERRKELNEIRKKGIKRNEENYRKYQPEYEEYVPEEPKAEEKGTFAITTTSDIVESDNGYEVDVLIDNQKSAKLSISREAAEKMEQKNKMFTKFKAKIHKESVNFLCQALVKKGALEFISFA